MKRTSFAFLLIALLGVGVLSFLYYWNQSTKLPEWYSSERGDSPKQTNSQETEAIRKKLVEKVEASTRASEKASRKDVEVKLSQNELNDLLALKIAENSNNKLLKSVKGSNTTIKDGTVESGVVANLSQIPAEQLGGNEQTMLKKLVQIFPHLKDQEVYIGIEGKPKIENNKIKFDEQTKIKLGDLKFSMSELSNQLGIPREELEKNLSLELGKLKVSDVELVEDSALIKGSVE